MKLKSFFCGLLVLATALGCEQIQKPEPELNLSHEAVTVEHQGGVITLQVKSDTDWLAVPDAEWVTLSTSEGTASEEPVTVIVNVGENGTESVRVATVTFTAADLVKELKITQSAKKAEEVISGTDSDLLVAWPVSSDMKTINMPEFDQRDANDKAAGFSDRKLPSTIGTGEITFYQESKADFSTDKIYRYIGSKGEPMAYGVWEGDYFLFKAVASLPAASNVSIAFALSGSKCPMHWLLEYQDGDVWKPASEPSELNGVSYNVTCTNTTGQGTVVNEQVVLRNETDAVMFRLKCVSKYSVEDGGLLDVPQNKSYVRIDPQMPIIIKGGAITDEVIASVGAPSLAIDETALNLTAVNGAGTLSITANVDWTVSVPADAAWLSCDVTSGTASETVSVVNVTAAENTAAESRTATLTFTAAYGNVQLTKTVSVTQEGKAAPAGNLCVKWEWNETAIDKNNPGSGAELELKTANEQTFKQNTTTDFAAGDAGKYINATTGNGKLSYVQQDKSQFQDNSEAKSYRDIGKHAEALIYGAWIGDYFLFEASDGQTYPSGSKVKISFGLYGANNGLRDWILEFYEEGQWKTAIELVQFPEAEKNYKNFEATVTTAAENSDGFKFRLRSLSDVPITPSKAGDHLKYPKSHQRLAWQTDLVIQVVE